MKAADIVGLRVVAVYQVRQPVESGRIYDRMPELVEILFERGIRLRFHVNEHDDGYGVQGIVWKPKPGTAKGGK